MLDLMPLGAEFWALFCLTLFPSALSVACIHLFLHRLRGKGTIPANWEDTAKIFLSVGGLPVGLFLWGLLYVVTN